MYFIIINTVAKSWDEEEDHTNEPEPDSSVK